MTRLGLLTAAGAAAVGAMILTAPLANAIPEHTIQSECDEANHGTYTTMIDQNGDRISMCCYDDNKSKVYCDYYKNGKYEGTTPNAVVTQPVPTLPTEGNAGTLGAARPKPPGASRPTTPITAAGPGVAPSAIQ
jgi:hypothetical protein